METQVIVKGAMENQVGLVLDGRGSAHETGALVAWGLDGRGKVAFAFNAKVMATGAEAGEGGAVFAV